MGRLEQAEQLARDLHQWRFPDGDHAPADECPGCVMDSLVAELRTAEAENARLREALARAAYVAEHLFQMIDKDTWRATGEDDGQGHYEGDYRAEQIAEEVKSWAALVVPAPAEGEKK